MNIKQRFGTQAISAAEEWKKMLNEAQTLPSTDKLRLVNDFFNRRIQFMEDIDAWKQSDYWATPMETLASGRGDCEDYTIAKYFTLLSAGIPVQQLRLIYVKASFGGPRSTLQQAHMVLAYYATLDDEPVVLDNLLNDIRPASRRPDLHPVFSFNSEGIWAGTDSKVSVENGRLSRWQNLLQRARAEGFN